MCVSTVVSLELDESWVNQSDNRPKNNFIFHTFLCCRVLLGNVKPRLGYGHYVEYEGGRVGG